MQERPIPAARETGPRVNWPPGLRDRILAGALSGRDAGRPVDPPPGIPPFEAFRRTVRSMDALLTVLTDAEWTAPAIRGLTVQGLIGHLIGVERDFLRAVRGLIPAQPGAEDHIGATQTSALEQLGKSPDQTLHDWRQSVTDTRQVLRDCAEDDRPTAPVSMHGITLPVGDFLVVRAFEMWTHEEDVRRATGRPLSPPDDATLSLMSRLAATLLPHAMARTGYPAPAEVRLVLTGRGGGTFTVQVGEQPAEPPDRARLIMDTVQFCRVVADRLADVDVTVDVSGDPTLAAAALAGARSLALD
jgi:uncharacterized protein (TIGR03083 family)